MFGMTFPAAGTPLTGIVVNSSSVPQAYMGTTIAPWTVQILRGIVIDSIGPSATKTITSVSTTVAYSDGTSNTTPVAIG